MQWRSKKQPVTSVSSAAAEIYALAEGVRDTRLNAWKAEELGYERPRPIDIQVDNSAGISFQTKMSPDSRMKGVFDLRWEWVRELQNTQEIRAVKVNTLNNIADLLTKCHSRTTFDKLMNLQRQFTLDTASRYLGNIASA